MATVVVIGGGPAGMMAAISAAEHHQVILLEKNEKLGKKLYITGKGRCNITNAKDLQDFFDYIPGNPHFLYSALYTFTNQDTMNFFEKLGVKLKVERGDRVFPLSDKSSDILQALQNELVRRKVRVILQAPVEEIHAAQGKITAVKLADQRLIEGDYFILCTGGLSYPKTGSTGEGFIFAKNLGHTIVNPAPSLVPLEIKEEWIQELQGLSLKNIELQISDKKGKTLYKEFGEMLFTHFGISGPVVLSGSRVVKDGGAYSVVINLKPALSCEELDKRIQKDFQKYINRDYMNAFDDLLPQKLIGIVVRLSDIDPHKKVNLITRDERKALVYLLQHFTLSVKGLRPIAEAIVTRGGITVKEVDPSTMRSKLIENLAFAGEVLDVDAYTGGYNIQIALSTGYLAGLKIDE